MYIRHALAIICSGLLWMGIGIFLLLKGFSLLLHPEIQGIPLLLPYLTSMTTRPEQGSLLLVSFGLLIGFIKGRLILSKTARRIIARIGSLPNPCKLSAIYPTPYLFLLLGMMSLGILFKWLPIPYDIKGIIDIGVGSALMNGSAFYFRYFAEKRHKKPSL